MVTIYAILLYLQVICTCTYEKPVMDQIISDNQPMINQVQQDPALMQHINENYMEPGGEVVIIDLLEDR